MVFNGNLMVFNGNLMVFQWCLMVFNEDLRMIYIWCFFTVCEPEHGPVEMT